MTETAQFPACLNAFMELVRARTSCRAYDSARPVPRETIRSCVEAARMAPSACNRQPWQFVVIDQPATVATVIESCKLPGIPHPWWADVPVFVAVCAKLDVVAHRIAPLISGIPYYLLDLGIAGEHFVLAAQAAGLGTCWVGWFREKQIKKLLGIPRNVRVGALITVGYPKTDREQKREMNRKPLPEILSWNQWKQPD